MKLFGVILIIVFVVLLLYLFGYSIELLPQTVEVTPVPTLTADQEAASVEACAELINVLNITFTGEWKYDCSRRLGEFIMMYALTADGNARLLITSKKLDANPCGEMATVAPYEDEGLFLYFCGEGAIGYTSVDGEIVAWSVQQM